MKNIDYTHGYSNFSYDYTMFLLTLFVCETPHSLFLHVLVREGLIMDISVRDTDTPPKCKAFFDTVLYSTSNSDKNSSECEQIPDLVE